MVWIASIRRRGNSFTITTSLGYDKNGKQIRKFTTYTPPADVAPRKALKLAHQHAILWEDKIKGYISLDENRTFHDLAEWYFENIAPMALKESVTLDNKEIIDTYVLPTIGREKLKNITPQMLDVLFRSLLTNGKVKQVFKLKNLKIIARGTKTDIARKIGLSRHTVQRASFGYNIDQESAEKIAGCLDKKFDEIFTPASESRELAPGTVSRIRRSLSAIFSTAVRKEIMRRNPVLNTESIKYRRYAESFLDEQQAILLLRALKEHKNTQFSTMITALLMTGMRGGELCGLKWDSVDLDKGIIYIRATLAYNRGNKTRGKEKYTLQTPKTITSERYIAIPSTLVDMLKRQKINQEKKKVAYGQGWIERGTVFCTTNGDYYSESWLNVQFKRLAQQLELPSNTHIHSLRHTTASLLINGGESAKAVAEQLGHTTTAITNDLYAHIFASSKIKTMQVLEMKLLNEEHIASS